MKPIRCIATLTLGWLATATLAGSPYAGQVNAPIKALTAEEQAALLDGQGAGFAKAAELNGYPGPKHVLELSAQLGLDRPLLESSFMPPEYDPEASTAQAGLIARIGRVACWP